MYRRDFQSINTGKKPNILVEKLWRICCHTDILLAMYVHILYNTLNTKYLNENSVINIRVLSLTSEFQLKNVFGYKAFSQLSCKYQLYKSEGSI